MSFFLLDFPYFLSSSFSQGLCEHIFLASFHLRWLRRVNSPARRSTFSQRCEGVVPLCHGLHPAGEKPATYTTRLQETPFPLLAPPKIIPLPLVTVISRQRLGHGFLFKYPAWDLSFLNP